MNTIRHLYVILLCTFSFSISAQNLLNTSTWTVGSGSVSGFSQNGSTTENIREYGANHIGENIILWKAVPDATSNADGGWNSSYHNIDNTKKYRLSVWIKKTNSNNGTTYFGCNSHNGSYQIYGLTGSLYTNPYFYNGDLPKLDRWYLLVGYVHEKTFSGTEKLGGIYDGVTGEKIQDIHREFKFGSTANDLMHRAYLYYDTNTSDRQYFYDPKMEQINGSEYTLNELLSLNPSSKLQLAYDNSGNQKQRFYCPDGASCSAPTGKSVKGKEVIAEKNEAQIDEEINLDDQLKIYPNPTKDIVYIKIESELLIKVKSVKIYNTNSSLIETLEINNPNQNLEVDLAGKPIGVYFIHIHLNDGSASITKKIIKN